MKSVDIYPDMPEEVEFILRVLNDNGYEAFIVGGCVRDSMLGNEPQDWDIASNATPYVVKTLFDRTIDTGIRYGTVSVFVNDRKFEITTYRIDGRYIDGRRPENVRFASSLTDDLSRRDFTVNAIAYHPEKGIVDPFNGMEDIKNRLIRTVGNPFDRFAEDALRMLRAVRFSARLNYTVEENTLESIKECACSIVNISRERIRDELSGILASERPEKFMLLRETGLLRYILPEFDACFEAIRENGLHSIDLACHSLQSVKNIESDPVLRWTMLLHDIGRTGMACPDKPGIGYFRDHAEKGAEIAGKLLRRLKFGSKAVEKVCVLVRHHERYIEPDGKSVRETLRIIGSDIFRDLLKVIRADVKAQKIKGERSIKGGENIKDEEDKIMVKLRKLDGIEAIYEETIGKNHCYSLKNLAVNGSDLINAGIVQGRETGNMLNRLLDLVIENPEANVREKLMEIAGQWSCTRKGVFG